LAPTGIRPNFSKHRSRQGAHDQAKLGAPLRASAPDLEGARPRAARGHRPAKILIEDAGVGTALVAELRAARLPAIAVKPEHNKVKIRERPSVFPARSTMAGPSWRRSYLPFRMAGMTIKSTASVKPWRTINTTVGPMKA
jgi:hypothetical protein